MICYIDLAGLIYMILKVVLFVEPFESWFLTKLKDYVKQTLHNGKYNKLIPTFKLHSDVQTFLESAVWASFPLCLVDDAAPIRHASIDLFILNSAFEEAFAALAC